MIAVQVTYKINAEFLEENKRNIATFLADFKELRNSKFLYHVYAKDDGLTFVHISMYENEQIQNEVLNIPSFLVFQQERDEKGLVAPPLIENLQHLGSSISMVK
ncbi:hypothetical protein [Pedobacter sp.]